MTEPGGDDTILIADGDVLVRHALAEYLRGCGYAVVEAADAGEAETLLAAPDCRIDIVLCDAELPGDGHGFGLRQRTRATQPGIEFILAGNVAVAAEAAADLCDKGPDLARPYDPQLVVGRITQWRSRKSG